MDPQQPEMKTYIGTKMLRALPMTRGEYCTYRGWPVPENENPLDSGFLVEYSDGGKPNDSRHAGYISWSPSDVFNRTYHEVSGSALEISMQSPDLVWNKIILLVNEYASHALDACNHVAESRVDISKSSALKSIGKLRELFFTYFRFTHADAARLAAKEHRKLSSENNDAV